MHPISVNEFQSPVVSESPETTRAGPPLATAQASVLVPVNTGVLPYDFLALSISSREQVVHQQLHNLLMMQAASGHHQHHHHYHHHNGNTEALSQTLAISPVVTESMNTASATSEVILDMDQRQGGATPQGHTVGQSTGSQQSGSGTAGHGHRRNQVGEQLQGIPGLRTVVQNLEGAVPFLLLLFAKVMYNHRFGLLVFVAMLGTFFYANSYFKKLITIRDNQTWHEAVLGFLWIFTFLAANIFFIYFIFGDQKLYRCLYFQSIEAHDMDLWTLLWMVVITDFVIKFSTVILKSVIAVIPKYVLPYKRKGKYYLLIEKISQFYRCLVPVKPWIIFMLEDKYGGEWVAIVLLVAYCCFKAVHLKNKFLDLMHAAAKFRVDSVFGTSPSKEEMKAFDNTCPICQDVYTDAVKLSCKHIFCDDCICLWLDREKTCPMCRAHIADNPIWRDGSTCALVQFY